MRSLGMLAGGLAAVLMAGAASAAPVVPAQAPMAGASIGAPMQQGAWQQSGWQPGATPMARPAPQFGHGGRDGWNRGRPPKWHGDYRRPTRGWRMPRLWMDPTYTVSDWQSWGLGEPGPGMRWVRYYDDAVLVDAYGRVVDARDDFNWDGGYGAGPAYAGGPGYGPGYGPPPGVYSQGPGVSSYHAGPNTTVTTQVIPMAPPIVMAPPAYGYGYGGGYYAGAGSVVTVTPGAMVTTTTTTTSYDTVYKSVAVRRAAPRKVWRRPIHRRCVKTTCPVLGS